MNSRTLVGVALVLGSMGILVGNTQASTPEKLLAQLKARAAGLQPAGVGQAIPWSPFVRLIRQGSTQPLDVAVCAKVVAVSGAGQLKTLPNGKPFYANPHPYIGLQMTLASGYEEYIEAGLGYDARTPNTGVFFRPYIRRAPDTYDAGGPQPPSDFESIPRNGTPLPGYWAAKRDDLARLMAVDGEICMRFDFDPDTNLYRFQYTIQNPAFGKTPFQKTLYMASARLKMDPKSPGVRIAKFQSRLLTSVATSGENFDPKDPVFNSTLFGVAWRASVRDRALSGSFEPYAARNFTVANYDPVGDIIYYRLDPL